MRTHILMIYCDELRADFFGFAGHDRARTPHLDALAAKSVVFDRAYVPCPICMPSRTALATGRYPRSNGCLDNATPALEGEAQRSLYRLFADAGWGIENVGKYHLGWSVTESGFQVHEPVGGGFGPFGPADPELRRRTHFRRLDGDLPIVIWGETPIPPEENNAALTVDAALRRLETYDPSEPFFLRVAINQPHTPYVAPAPYSRWYDGFEEPVPDSFGDAIRTKPTLVQLFYANRRYQDLTFEDVRRCRASYLGLVSYIDHEVGRLLAGLRARGLEDSTIVVFTSDHGTCLGEHGWIEKWAQLWEETCRVPLLIRHPDYEPGRAGTLVEQFDLMPTLLELCGIPRPDGLAARSLVPVLEDPSRVHRDAVFAETFIPALMTEPACSIRTREWKLTDYPRMADVESRLPGDHPRRNHPLFDPENLVEGELYDLRTDPGESNNLWADPSYADVTTALRERLDAWRRSCEPTVDWSEFQPPAGFHWSQQRLIEGATLRRISEVWGASPPLARRRGET